MVRGVIRGPHISLILSGFLFFFLGVPECKISDDPLTVIRCA